MAAGNCDMLVMLLSQVKQGGEVEVTPLNDAAEAWTAGAQPRRAAVCSNL